jgi:extradiol dioxygenase family protein
MNTRRFHLSLPCINIKETKTFYQKQLGFEIGRKAYAWFDIDIYGNQVTFTQEDTLKMKSNNYRFEDILLPSFHFGVILEAKTWETLHEQYKDQDFFAMGTKAFLKDKTGQHRSFFVIDPNGYFIEFKNFKSNDEIFKSTKE